jgi:PAS domain S-box-containing protein
MRILSVDDNAENRYLVEMMARAHGHEVVSASNGVDALDQLATGSFDLIISDVLMPEMDGFRLCISVKSDERLKHIPFIFYTATYTARQDAELGLSLGASRFLLKPAEPEEFLAVVEQVVCESASGSLPVPAVDLDDGGQILSLYSQRLVRKLEHKIQQLEAARTELDASIQERDQEIAQRRQAEEALRGSEEQLRLMWEGSKDGMRISDRHGIILRANPALARMFAKPLNSLEGQSFTCCYGVDDPEPMLSSYREEVESGTLEAHFESLLRRWDGEEIWVDGSYSMIELASGPVIFSILRDVTQRKRAEQERSSLEDQLRQAQKLESIGRLAGGIAHDFNNLLTVINGYSTLILAKLGETDPLRRSIQQVLEAGERATALTRQLLLFSRKQSVMLKPLNVNEMLTGAGSMIQRMVGDDVEVAVRTPEAPAWVMADTGLLHQVLMNLAVNARDAMPKGGKLIIEVALKQVDQPESADSSALAPGSYVLLTVTDAGVGMDEETRRRAFEPFFTTKEQGKGTGLGLSIVYGIVRQCGGSIGVDTALGRGTTFRIYLPQLDANADYAEAAVAAASVPRGSETILVVDDNEPVRALVAEILKSSGYRVIEASSGSEALLAAGRSSGPIHLLLTDVQMPQGTGVELAERLRPLRPGMRVLYMSGAAAESASPRIAKPFNRASLTAKVREVLGPGS